MGLTAGEETLGGGGTTTPPSSGTTTGGGTTGEGTTTGGGTTGGGGGAIVPESGGGGNSSGSSPNGTINPYYPPCHSDRDDFWKFPIRSLKGGGTKCTTCEKREKCHECCTCVYEWICVTYNVNCVDLVLLNANPNLKAFQWDCVNNHYDLSFSCDGYVIDLFLKYKKYGNYCVATLISEYYGFDESNPLTLPFTDCSNCRLPYWDFDLNGYDSIIIRPYNFVSLGNQRCIDRGPDDCTGGRCLPRNLCTKIYTPDKPDSYTAGSMSWYENNAVEVSGCCCNATTFPDTLIARFDNFSESCNCVNYAKTGNQYWPAKHAGYQISDAGAILHLRHKIASNYDYYVNNYPFVPTGANVWESEGFLSGTTDITSICPGFSNIGCPSTPGDTYPIMIGARSILWCDTNTNSWRAALEIIDIQSAQDNSNTDHLTKPYDISNIYSNVYLQDVEIPSCRPFHVKMGGIYEPTFCANTYGVKGSGNLEFKIQEFIGWTGAYPLDNTRMMTLYTERVNVAAPIQTIESDCVPKIHIQASGYDTLKDRRDRFDIDNLWPDLIFEKSSYIPCSGPTKIEVFPEPCGGCEGIPGEDPYATDVQTQCCVDRISKTLTVTIVSVNNCPGLSGVTFNLTWDSANEEWSGTYTSGSCSICMKLDCGQLLGSYVFRLSWGQGGSCTDFIWNPDPMQDVAFTCSPFYWETRNTSAISAACCQPVGTPNQSIKFIISE